MNFDTDRPVWLQLWKEFTRQVVIGRWAPGKQIPGVRELAVRLGINPNTVQRTFVELERDDLCCSERTVGWFVIGDAECVSRLRCDLAVRAADELIARVESFGLPKAKAVALIAERWNQQ